MIMRRFFLVALVVVCAVLTASAQPKPKPKVRVEWGVMGGINIPNFSTRITSTEVKDKLGWQFGIQTGVVFGAIAIQPEIMFVRQGFRMNTEGVGNENLRSNSIDVPVLFSLRILKPVRINVGPVFTVMNDCKRKTGGDLLDFGRVRPTVSYTVGVGVTIMRHLLLDVRYNGQFSSVKNTIADVKIDSYNIAFSVGYLF